MRKLFVVFLVTGSLGLGLLVPRGSSAPAPADRSARFEYGELRFSDVLVRPAGQPGGPKLQAAKQVTARWNTANEEVEGKDWADLGDKLKAPAAKKDSDVAQKLRVFDRLGAEGWEVYEHTSNKALGTTDTWSLRRRVP